jgi:hypothetical protein
LDRRLAAEVGVESASFRAALGLFTASLVVAVAILVDGAAVKTLNGIGGLLWIGSAVILIRSLRLSAHFAKWFSVIFADCLLLVIFVKPTNLVWALIGFGLGGVLIGLLMGAQALNWAPLLPALWLAIHLLVAISRAVLRSIEGSEASVRSDPPPTAALVPFAMVVATFAGAWLVDWFRRRNRAKINSLVVDGQ